MDNSVAFAYDESAQEYEILNVNNDLLTANTTAVQTNLKEKSKIYKIIKRTSDVVLSFLALIFLSPILLIFAILIKLEDGGTILYSQTRCGKNSSKFKMYKFRSMCPDAEAKLASLQALNERDGPVFKITNDPRVTKIGSFMRKTCIDELPQLINILKGEMSIVGPRPPLVSEVEQYTPYDLQRLSVTPGLTCYWQIRKHDNVTFAEWVDMDLEYIKEQSTFIDFKIIFLTFLVLLFKRGDM